MALSLNHLELKLIRELNRDRPECERALYIHDQMLGVYPTDKPLPKCKARAIYLLNGQAFCGRHVKDVVFDHLCDAVGIDKLEAEEVRAAITNSLRG